MFSIAYYLQSIVKRCNINDIIMGFGAAQTGTDKELLYCAKITQIMDWKKYMEMYDNRRDCILTEDHKTNKIQIKQRYLHKFYQRRSISRIIANFDKAKVLISDCNHFVTFFEENNAEPFVNQYAEIQSYIKSMPRLNRVNCKTGKKFIELYDRINECQDFVLENDANSYLKSSLPPSPITELLSFICQISCCVTFVVGFTNQSNRK